MRSEIRALDLTSLDKEQRLFFRSFTAEEFYPYLAGKYPSWAHTGALFAYAAYVNNEPVGLLLGSSEPEDYKGKIFSLFVQEPYRRKKIASQLLETAEKRLTQDKCVIIEKKYCDEAPYADALKKLFASRGWKNPEPLLIQYWFDKSFNPSWIHTTPPFPEGFQEFNWKQLKAKERKELLRQHSQRRFPLNVSPFLREEQIDYHSSLGLRYKDTVIGWMITHRIDPETVRFTCLYIDPEFRRTPFAPRLLGDACLRNLEIMDSIPYAYFELNLDFPESVWVNFIKKRLAPHCFKILHYNMGWKQLIS